MRPHRCLHLAQIRWRTMLFEKLLCIHRVFFIGSQKFETPPVQQHLDSLCVSSTFQAYAIDRWPWHFLCHLSFNKFCDLIMKLHCRILDLALTNMKQHFCLWENWGLWPLMLVLKLFLCWWKLSDFNAIILTYSFVLSFKTKKHSNQWWMSHSHQRFWRGHEIVRQIKKFSTGR